MPLENFGPKPSPSETLLFGNTVPIYGFDIPISGNEATCEVSHCGTCGECRRKLWVENGSESVPNDGAGNPGLNPYKANGSYIIVEDPDPSASSFVEYYGESFKSLAAFNAVCDQDTGSRVTDAPGGPGGTGVINHTGCYDPLISFDTNVPSFVYVPTHHRTQTECLAFAASLPSGESVAWYTTYNTSTPYLYKGIGLDGNAGYKNPNGPTE
tara:strand:- start:1478 stop:2113 length:636 start_codon:yes stop_codon:yes gene_type:complete